MNERIPYDQVEGWLTDLPEWKSRLETLQAQMDHIPGLTQQIELVNIHGKGQKNEAILNEVIRRMQVNEIEIPLLQAKIQVLETAIRGLRKDELELVELKYRMNLPALAVAEKLNITLRSFYRLRRRTLEHLYRIAGGKNSILGLKDEIHGTEATS
ncbi:hypothetical protein [Ferviditalea candida]|uniref:Uncharacterized protein n=1 Tax=Ferviditalea candida TaxID=3108399 RepID=A0ABU5ZK07_9BACL|nr:hypothetical protein [Paenibacillaceae bacterium T2]